MPSVKHFISEYPLTYAAIDIYLLCQYLPITSAHHILLVNKLNTHLHRCPMVFFPCHMFSVSPVLNGAEPWNDRPAPLARCLSDSPHKPVYFGRSTLDSLCAGSQRLHLSSHRGSARPILDANVVNRNLAATELQRHNVDSRRDWQHTRSWFIDFIQRWYRAHSLGWPFSKVSLNVFSILWVQYGATTCLF